MRRFYFTCASLVIVALTALVFASKSSAQQSDEIQKYIEMWRLDHQMEIELIQENYFKNTGHYWQGLATHSEAAKPEYQTIDKTQPIDEKSFPADALSIKPTDQQDQPSWTELFPNVVDKLPADLRIDVYDGPDGMGYVIGLSYCVDGLCYVRSVNVGPESWRSTDWIAIKEVVSK
jgi:hypothetical protein